MLDLQKVVIAKGITNALAADVRKVESEVLLTSHHPSPCRKRIRTMSARIQRRSDFTTDPTGSNPISNRTGIAPGKDVLQVEKKLLKFVPDEFRQHAHHWLILHGRYVCKARQPDCPVCEIRDLCELRHKTVSDKP